MKKNFIIQTRKVALGLMLMACFSILMFLPGKTEAQVNFVQTTDADFNQGVLNNVIVGSNNVYLQFSATEVGSWLTSTVLPQTLSGHKIVSWTDRYAYLIGGFNGLSYSNSVYYAPVSGSGVGTWASQNSLPAALRDPAVVVGNNTIFVLGGRDGSQVYNTIYYAPINPNGTLGAWQTSAVSLPVNLWGHSAVYNKGYLYVAGGSSSMTLTTAINNVYFAKVKVDNTLSTFSAGTALPAARNRNSMVTYNGNLYVLGGYDNTGTRASSVYIATAGLNGAIGAWSSGTSLPVAISNHASVATNGIITIMAGETASGLTNTVYFANADAGSLTWLTSANAMYDITKDGSAFQCNGNVFYGGGTNPSGSPIFNCRYAHLTLSANVVNHGVFVSTPFTQLGAERLINSLSFTSAFTSPANCQISYRLAGNDGIWGDWTALASTSPITISATKRYLQYSVSLTGSAALNSTLQDATLTTPGTQLSGDISAITTFTKALSPYWATSDINFSSGTHTFQAGATILFLPQTGLTIGQANVICSGTAVDSVKFMYYTNETGQWKGLYFDPNSDNGVSSQFNYTAIIGGGYGSWSANLYCNQSNEPLLTRCSIRNSGSHGINLNLANINIQNSSVRTNALNGIYANSSNPTILNSALSYNGGAGVYLTNTISVPTYNGTTIDHNLYGIRYETPNATFYRPNGNPTMTANTYNGVAINGGTINAANRTWNYIPYDYILLGTVQLNQYPSVRLTIEPGNTIKCLPGVQLQVSTGGELYALGTVDSLITFTPHNGVAGGWDGLYFMDASDSWGAQSQLDYCVIEKGNNYNYFSENTVQPNLVNHTKIQNSLVDGARYATIANVPSGSVTNSQFLNNGRYPLYILDGFADPARTGNTYTGNIVNRIALAGGMYSVNRTLTTDAVPYFVLNDLTIGGWGAHPRLTLNPGVTIEFEVGKKLSVGAPAAYGGELYAQGTVGNPITFQAHNLTPGGWSGLYFPDQNDNWSGTSLLEYCTIKQADSANILIETSSQPTINRCTISNSLKYGISEYQSNPPITNTVFSNNGSYPIKYKDWSCDSYLRGNTFTANTPNYISLSGGDYSSNRIIYYTGIPYEVKGDIRIMVWAGHSRITVQPGVTLAFNPGTKLQVGATASYGGDLYAEGKSDSIITFKPLNNTIGGWGGILFVDQNDNWGGTSSLKYCSIVKGSAYNLSIETSAQPSIDRCTFDQSGGVGINVSNSVVNITNSIISNSASNGIAGPGITGQILACQYLNNGSYPLKFSDIACNPYIHNNTYTGNVPNYVYVAGGDNGSAMTFHYDGIPYRIFSDIRMLGWGGHPRLTVKPGISLLFEPGVKIQLGGTTCCNGGEIFAEGKADSLITFAPFNNTAGGWGGIYFPSYNDDWSGVSSLKYCTITKGAGYNVNVEGSNQPSIDHCSLTQSTGKGLIINSSTLTVTNSTFSYNSSYGIMMDGTNGICTIGNTAATTCNLYNNGGGYQLYNNCTANVNARNNYWGTSDSTMIESVIYDRYDNSAKGIVYIGPYAQIPASSTPTTILGGTLKYANSTANPMKNSAMVIKDFAGTTIASTTSNSLGVYAFSAFPSGGYQMFITPAAPWGAGNSTDALLILNHFALIAPLSGMRLAAADVNASHTINGTDALLVMRRFTGAITSFPAGNYLYHADTIFTNGNQVTNNIKMACFGDCDLSYAPLKKSTGSVGLIHEGTISVPSNSEFDFPVKMQFGMQAGAISLGFYYPEQYLEITGATLSNGNNSFTWTAVDGLFRMGWADVNSLNLANGSVVVTLKMKSKDLSSLTGNIALQLFEESEFADPLAVVNPGVVLSVQDIASGITGIEPGNTGFALSVHPNPVKDKTIIEFNLEREGKVTIGLYNMVGELVKSTGSTVYAAGKQQVSIDASNVPDGVYMLKVEISDSDHISRRLIKLVVSR